MKQIPNIFTLLNLFLGCMAIVYVMQPGLSLTVDPNGENLVALPERMTIASIFIFLAAIVDFLDGLVARLLKATSELGKQLDSLSDVVSFGVAPGVIAYQFLRLCFAEQPDGLDISFLWLVPAFLLPCAGAFRLARFNVDISQKEGFTGVPIPAVGLLFASFPLIYWYAAQAWQLTLLQNKWFWYAVILLASYLMVSKFPMLALKFKKISFKGLLPFLILALVALSAALLTGWFAVPVTFIAYVILSLVINKQTES